VIEASVVVVEDDDRLRGLLLRGLREAGFQVEGLIRATDLLERLPHVDPDVLVLDVGLPDADGRDLCQALRAQGFSAPIMFLTARDAVPDRLTGFAAGGDDYLTKPFNFAELVARLQALIRRGGGQPVAEVGSLRLDPARHDVSCNGERVELTPTEFRVFAALASRPGEAIRRRDLIRAGWPAGAIVHDNTLDVYIAALRKKLSALPGAPAIKTIHGVGYSIR
jgi:two-component system, OmpR family, response regulator